MLSQKNKSINFRFVITLSGLLLLNTLILLAQPGIGISYRFSTAVGTIPYPTAGAIAQVVSAGNQDDFAYLFTPAGMNLKFGGNTYQKFVVSTNGWIALLPASQATIPAGLSGGGYLNSNQLSTYNVGYPLIAPFWDNIAATAFSYNYTANALWVRFTVKIDNTNATPGSLFWVKIDGITGEIIYYYTNTAYAITGTPTASIGIAGICTGDYYSYNLPAALTYADSTIETSNISTKPMGVTYTFTPYQLYDNCITAKDLSPLTGTCAATIFNINNALSSGAPITCSPTLTDTADVWFKITKPIGVINVIIATSPATPACQSVSGTSIEVFTLCGGIPVGCATTSVANPGFGQLALSRPCTGETLYIRVTADGDQGGKFKICVNSNTTVTGIDCAGAVPVCAPLPFSASGLTTLGSGDQYSNNVLCQSDYLTGQDYVFTYTPAITQCVNISITGTGANSYPGLFLLDGCPNDTDFSTCVASAFGTSGGDTISNITIFGGHTYYIVIDNNSILSGTTSMPFNFQISNSLAAAPPNDNCLTPQALPVVNSTAACTWTTTFTTQCATPSPSTPGYPNPGCGGFTGFTNDVWLTFTAGYTGTVQINSQGGATNPVIHGGMAIYTGTCGALTLVACSGDSVAIPFMPSLAFPIVNLTQYYIRFWSATGYDPGTFRLCFIANCNPPNDLPINAIAIPLAVPTLGDNTCSTGASEMPTPVNCTSAPINTVWFKITVPPSGQVAVRISQYSLLDAAVAAFTFPTGPANAATSFTRLACNDDIIFAPPCPICGMTGDNDAAIQFNTLPGSTVYLAVDGEFSAVGSFWITAIEGNLLSVFPPIIRKDCGNPETICSNNDFYVPNGGIGSNGNVCDFLGLTCAPGPNTSEVGSTWLQFTVAPGSPLGFTITPNDSMSPIANYNFYLWDVTGLSNVCSQLTTLTKIRCNSSPGTGKTGLRNPTTAVYSDIVPSYPVPHNYLLFVQNLTSANDDEGVPGTNTGFLMNWDVYSGGINIGKTQISGTSTICNWTGTVVDTNYQNALNWKGLATCPAPVPSCTTDVFIFPATKQCWVTGNSYAKNITINAGGILVLMPGSILHVCGNFINNGTLIAQPGSTVIFEGGNTLQNISGNLIGANSFANLTVFKSGAQVILLNNIDLKGNFSTGNLTSVFNINGKYMKVGGNFSNFNGTTTFTGIANSTVEFNGTANANFINLNGNLNLNRVKMDKTPGKLYLTGANSKMNIDSSLTLTNGIIVTRASNSLEVNMKYYLPASVTGHNAASFIDGKLRRKISNGMFSSPIIPASYDFPLGDSLSPGGYELANITFTTATLTFDLTGTFSPWPASGAPNPGPVASECLVATYSNLPIFDNGYWTFKRSTANFTGRYSISLYNTGYTNNFGLGWTVAKSDTLSDPALSASWRLIGNCVITSTPNNTQRAQINPSPYADSLSFNHHYATVQTEMRLPIKLLYFTAEPKGEQVICEWETASETNNDYFVVERSTDGEEFIIIGREDGYGAGISTEIKYYNLIDDEFCENIVYYRLRQVDIDGNFTYSDVVAVNCGDHQSMLTLHPNPAQLSVTLTFIEPMDGEVIIKFIDFTGREVYSISTSAVKGYNQLPISIDKLNDGVYYIDVHSVKFNSNGSRQIRFIKN